MYLFVFLYLLGAFLLVLSNSLIKYVCVNNILTTNEIIFLKSLISVLILLPCNAKYVAEKQTRKQISKNLLLLFFIGIATLISQFSWINGIQLVPMNNAWLMMMIFSPILSTIGGKIIFKEKIDNKIKIAFIINIFAILLVNRFSINKIEWNIGYLFLICDLFAYTAIILLTRKLKDLPSSLLVFIRFVVVLPFSIIAIKHIPSFTYISLLLVLLISLFSVFGRIFTTKTYKYLKVSIVQPLRYFDIVFSIIISFFILFEKPTLYQIVGSVIIIMSGFFVGFSKMK